MRRALLLAEYDLLARHPPFSMREYSSILKKSNRSGVVGACRYCSSETRDLPAEQQRWFWVASWPSPGGKRKRAKFAVGKYGEDKAFRLALKARREAMRALEGSFDPGARRREGVASAQCVPQAEAAPHDRGSSDASA